MQTGAQVDDPKRFKFEGDQHYLKTAAEMRALFAEVPEACDNTLRIAERANVEIEFGKPELPRFPLPAGLRVRGRLPAPPHRRGRRGALRRPRCRPTSCERIDHELGVIADMGLSAYFLVVWDLIRHARQKGIRVGPGPGLGGRVLRGLLPAHRRPRPHPLRPALRALPQRRAAGRCPTSTWTSTSATAAR